MRARGARSAYNGPTPGGVSRGRAWRGICLGGPLPKGLARKFRKIRKTRRFRTGFSGKAGDPGPKISENPENSEFP